MSDDDAATRLLEARADGDHFPDWLIGSIDLDTALDLQLAVLDQHLAAGAHVGGWKVGLTSEASRQRLGADERPFGFVLGERTFATPATIDASTIREPSIETEMCFTIGLDIILRTILGDYLGQGAQADVGSPWGLLSTSNISGIIVPHSWSVTTSRATISRLVSVACSVSSIFAMISRRCS